MRPIPTWPKHVSPRGRPPGNDAYCKDGCRCLGCKAGSAEAYQRRKRDSGRKRDGRKRGRSCYVGSGGKCGHEECLQANREYQRNYYRVHYATEVSGVDMYEDITDVS